MEAEDTMGLGEKRRGTDTSPMFLVAVHGGAGDHPSSRLKVDEIKRALRLYVSRILTPS